MVNGLCYQSTEVFQFHGVFGFGLEFKRLELTRKFVVASEMIVRQASWENGEGAEDLCRLFEI